MVDPQPANLHLDNRIHAATHGCPQTGHWVRFTTIDADPLHVAMLAAKEVALPLIREAVNTFLIKFFCALTVVLVVAFVTLGWRTGIVVALSVPLTLAIVALYMGVAGIGLDAVGGHRNRRQAGGFGRSDAGQGIFNGTAADGGDAEFLNG